MHVSLLHDPSCCLRAWGTGHEDEAFDLRSSGRSLQVREVAPLLYLNRLIREQALIDACEVSIGH